MSLRADSVLFLLGAGASVDAGLKTTEGMIQAIESLIKEKEDWKGYKDLYLCIKSGIHFKHGLRGDFNHQINVEVLVDTLNELQKRHEHTLSPFIGSWIPKLAEINYDLIEEFKSEIVNTLVRKWINIDNKNNANYYKKFQDFSKKYEYPLHLFSLNYDRCAEEVIERSLLERGFDENTRTWNHKKYKKSMDEGNPYKIYLYKMHGSIDWINKNGKTTERDSTPEPKDCEIIFGTSFKPQYIDPYFFFFNEFRNKLLDDAELLIVIGYSYSDEHVNKIISQAFRHNKKLKILNVSPQKPPPQDDMIEKIKQECDISDKLRIIMENSSARDFLNDNLSVEYIKEKLGITDPF